MDKLRTRIILFALLNSLFWICGMGLFLSLILVLFFYRDVRNFYIVPSIIGGFYSFICLLGIATTCSLPISGHFYYPDDLEMNSVQEKKSIPTEEPMIQNIIETPEQI